MSARLANFKTGHQDVPSITCVTLFARGPIMTAAESPRMPLVVGLAATGLVLSTTTMAFVGLPAANTPSKSDSSLRGEATRMAFDSEAAMDGLAVDPTAEVEAEEVWDGGGGPEEPARGRREPAHHLGKMQRATQGKLKTTSSLVKGSRAPQLAPLSVSSVRSAWGTWQGQLWQ